MVNVGWVEIVPVQGQGPSITPAVESWRTALTKAAGVEQTGALALREATSAAHRQVEQALALPGSILSRGDYLRWLVRFFGVYEPLEEGLDRFSDWARWNIEIGAMGHTAALRQDLMALEVDLGQITFASAEILPPLRSFAEALGALYVLEGSKLGGRYILMDLSARLPNQMGSATHFFSGNGAESGSRWNSFKNSLDLYCLENPDHLPAVIAGADETFQAIGAWMSPLGQRESEDTGEIQ